ncbi:unnamed protein product [Parnassius apollo]|uniref:(apollo) hypothetical protein n=1 Tax=Parnassius apollo TaxID=110799 RepID=A0A8S3W881_PARAO|nr:unnamed protein product [Parnassius apollo]
MNRCVVNVMAAIIILASLPYSSALSLPIGDPAPGRSPGPPVVNGNGFQDKSTNFKYIDENIETRLGIPVEEAERYDHTTTNDIETTTVSEVVSVSEKTIGDACAFARIPSDSADIVTLGERDSDINLTVSHPVFEADELVRGVVYDGKSAWFSI